MYKEKKGRRKNQSRKTKKKTIKHNMADVQCKLEDFGIYLGIGTYFLLCGKN